jgi:hypothetical protein
MNLIAKDFSCLDTHEERVPCFSIHNLCCILLAKGNVPLVISWPEKFNRAIEYS